MVKVNVLERGHVLMRGALRYATVWLGNVIVVCFDDVGYLDLEDMHYFASVHNAVYFAVRMLANLRQ